MRDREDLPGFVEAFSGGHRDVLDFLAEEVLGRQPEEARDFLLKTSVLERMGGALCDAVTGRRGGQGMLERLERENLFVIALDDERRWYRYHRASSATSCFVVPLDDERRWYRYHHLFRDFLRGRLRREDPELAGELHRRASGWYEENGYLDEAIGRALSAPDYERAVRLIGGGATQEAWSRGEVPTVLRWLGALPSEARRRRPRLLLQHAMALALTGRPDDAESLLTK